MINFFLRTLIAQTKLQWYVLDCVKLGYLTCLPRVLFRHEFKFNFYCILFSYYVFEGMAKNVVRFNICLQSFPRPIYKYAFWYFSFFVISVSDSFPSRKSFRFVQRPRCASQKARDSIFIAVIFDPNIGVL